MNDTFPTRFHAKYKGGDSDECWNWFGSKVPGGYGQIRAGGPNGKMLSAHRSAWEIAFGPIPKGLQVLHDCDNPGCVNPHHLTLGTVDDNMKDMAAKGRSNARRPRLSTDCKAEIVELQKYLTRAELAEQFNISQRYVRNICNLRTA